MADADAAATAKEDTTTLIIPLRSWIDGDAEYYKKRRSKESIIRQVTVAYGIVELVVRCPKNYIDLSLDDDDDAEIRMDNFAVCEQQQQKQQWDDVKGVSMLSSGISLSIEEPSYLSCLFQEGDEKGDQIMGRDLEVELHAAKTSVANNTIDCCDDSADHEERSKHRRRCHLVAKILYELFTYEAYPVDDGNYHEDEEPPCKKLKECNDNLMLKAPSEREGGVKAGAGFDLLAIGRMQQLGVPTSICRMMQSLIKSACGEHGSNAYESLKVVGEDLHLLLFDPDRFLFDSEVQNSDHMQLRYRKEKLYGRDKEGTLITDTFCRVTRGKSEAFFIGGFSGSGKSMLVDTLRLRVKNVGGYVIKHKFDAISQDRPLSGVISALDRLCIMVKAGLTHRGSAALSKQLKDDFGADIGLLARMLPNVRVLSPEFSSLASKVEDGKSNDKMNARSVSFTLLRFMRLISSPKRPVMLFLDDLQWADDCALEIIHTFLTDTMGSCIFFVGTYRDNEVQVGHSVFDLMEKLEVSNVPTTKVSLTGLDQQDLNEMISDAMCLYPRMCKPLSDIVFQKTKGNPFFVLEFMQSLQSRGLLRYDSCQKQWVWDEDTIRAEQITDNVQHLLSSKMNRLSANVQTLLKVMACFGTSTNESVIEYLSESPEYSGVRTGLEEAISDGFVEAYAERKFKFVHDKVREAAYNLIPDCEKRQLHYNLGKTLYYICENKDVGDTIFLIASQINHGRECIQKDGKELSIAVAKLNMKAGKKALVGCDHQTAYFNFHVALSLLPEDNWESYYDLTLQLNLLMARAANSSCKYDEAELILQTICGKAHCLHDKLPAFVLLSQILLAQGNPNEAYTTCSSVLTQLGETVPEVVTLETVGAMIPETLHMYAEVYGDDWLEKKMEDTTLCDIIKFYSSMATAAFFCKPPHMVAYFVCKTVQLSLRNGVCPHAPLAFMHLSSIVIRLDNSAFVHLISRNAMALSKRFGLSDQTAELCVNYYIAAGHLDSYHLGAKQLRKGFESGLSSGNASTAFYCAGHGVYFSMLGGEKDLISLRKEIDYYLHLLETYKSEVKNSILCIRETVSILIDNGEGTGIEATPCYGDLSDPGNKRNARVFYFHHAFRTYWLGHTERCLHFVQKFFDVIEAEKFEVYVMKFYHGLALLDILKKKFSYYKEGEVKKIIESMRVAASHAGFNFRNKLELLEAEQYVLAVHKRSVASRAYDTAITSARNAKLIHEQGLACEKAGFYYKRMKDSEKSLKYFNQARECYEEWGSTVKVDFIRRELDRFDSKNKRV